MVDILIIFKCFYSSNSSFNQLEIMDVNDQNKAPVPPERTLSVALSKPLPSVPEEEDKKSKKKKKTGL